MTFKCIGAAAMLLSSVLWGWTKIREARRCSAESEAIFELIEQIRSGIAYYLKPLPEIAADCSIKLLEENGFLPYARTSGFREAWRKTVFHLPMEISRTAERFFSALGGGYRAEELALCEETAGELKRKIAANREELGSHERLWAILPPILALSAVLLLL